MPDDEDFGVCRNRHCIERGTPIFLHVSGYCATCCPRLGATECAAGGWPAEDWDDE